MEADTQLSAELDRARADLALEVGRREQAELAFNTVSKDWEHWRITYGKEILALETRLKEFESLGTFIELWKKTPPKIQNGVIAELRLLQSKAFFEGYVPWSEGANNAANILEETLKK